MGPSKSISILSLLVLATACSGDKGPLEAPGPSMVPPVEVHAGAATTEAKTEAPVAVTETPATTEAKPEEKEILVTRFGAHISLYDRSLSTDQITNESPKPLREITICERKRESETEALQYIVSEPVFLSKDPKSGAQVWVKYTLSRYDEESDGQSQALHQIRLQIEKRNQTAPFFEELAEVEESRIVSGEFNKFVSHSNFWIRVQFSTEMQKECAARDTASKE